MLPRPNLMRKALKPEQHAAQHTNSSSTNVPLLPEIRQQIKLRQGPLDALREGGHCVFKWILRGHSKPTQNATI